MSMDTILREGFAELGIDADPLAIDRFRKYYEHLEQQNRVMNLTAITAEDDVARLHFLDCGALMRFADFAGKSVIDVGTGAGFPGLPLKILCPDIRLTLLDSLQKRVDFLRSTCDLLGLNGTECIHARAEEAPQLRETFDIAVSRAVARLNVLCELCLPFVKVGGVFIAMKGPGCAEELEEAKNAIRLLGGKTVGVYDYPVPGTDTAHCALIIEKHSFTPAKYPRRFAKIQKAPL